MAKKIDYKTYKAPSDFISFSEGETVIRILSDGYLVKKHEYRTGTVFRSMRCKEKKDCELCIKGYEPKNKWIWIVLDRTNKRCGILETGKMLGNQISFIGKKLGNPQEYDIIIRANGKNLERNYVTSKKPTSEELKPEEKEVISKSLSYLFNKYIKELEK